jgi:putative tryptophan/tyrosine transport system substrate-binding protein
MCIISPSDDDACRPLAAYSNRFRSISGTARTRVLASIHSFTAGRTRACGAFLVRCLSLLFALMLANVAAASPSVLVLLTEADGAYAEFAEALKNERGTRGGYSLAVVTRSALTPGDLSSHDLVVAVGAGALRAMANAADVAVPVLSVLVPQSAYESIATAEAGRRWSAIHIDQPYSRQLLLIRSALPEARLVGVLVNAEHPERIQALRAALPGSSLELVTGVFQAESSVFPALSRVLDQADVFLALPDPQAHNAGVVRNLLLTSFRARVPVVGFSAAYARAGAVMSLYSTPEQIARQAADLIGEWFDRRVWPEARYPRHFTVSVNAHVARSLGLRIEDEDALRDRLVRQERLP